MLQHEEARNYCSRALAYWYDAFRAKAVRVGWKCPHAEAWGCFRCSARKGDVDEHPDYTENRQFAKISGIYRC